MVQEANKDREVIIEEQAYKIAIEAAVEASNLVLTFWPNPLNPHYDRKKAATLLKDIQTKTGTGNYATVADIASEQLIVNLIRNNYLLQGHSIIGEESNEIVADPVWQWVIDPIDGTPNFANGLPDYGISIAVMKGQEPHIGVISVPEKQQYIAARKGHGAMLYEFDGTPLINLKQQHLETQRKPLDRILVACDVGYNNRQQQVENTMLKIIDRVGYSPSYGSCSISNYRLAQGLIGAYMCAAPTKFDIAAAAVIIQEIGGTVTDLQGNPINWSASSRSYLAALDPIIHHQVLQLLV